MPNRAQISLYSFRIKNYSENLISNNSFTKFNINDFLLNSTNNSCIDIFLNFRSFTTLSIFQSFVTYIESNPLDSIASLWSTTSTSLTLNEFITSYRVHQAIKDHGIDPSEDPNILAELEAEAEKQLQSTTPDTKLYYPEPFIASPSFNHEDI